jgi:predicted secreted protein
MFQHHAATDRPASLARETARRLLLCVIVATGAAACGTGPSGPDEFSDPSIPVRIEAGAEFALRLESNITTGFGWQLARPVDGAFLTFLNSAYEAAHGNLLGAPGAETWRFRAVSKGRTTIDLEYVQTSEPQGTPVRTTQFEVEIR